MQKRIFNLAAVLLISLMPIIGSYAKWTSPNISFALANEIDTNSFAVVNAKVYTVDRDLSIAQAVLVENGLLSKVGTDQQILDGLDESVRVIDLGGKFMMPGFQDAHLHLAEAGFNELMCLFDETLPSIESYRDQFEECDCKSENLRSPWILGAGISVSEMLFDKTQTPRAFLDELFPNKPVLILDNVGHGGWVNTKALMLAKYDVDQPIQPQGGIILTDSTGSATGVLFENAQQRVRDVAFQAVDPDQTLSYKGLLKGLVTLAENGVTSISDAGGYWSRNDQRLWRRAEFENKMTVRAFNALYVFPDKDVEKQISDISAMFSDNSQQLVKFNTVKIYVDGILSLGTSALNDEYVFSVVEELNYPRGFEYFTKADLSRYATAFDKFGFQMHFHVTGDRAVSLALDAIEQAILNNHTENARHRLTHAYIINKSDRPRFNQLGVIVDFQLNPSSLDTRNYRPFLQDILGAHRAKDLIPVNAMLEEKAKVILSSDYDAGPVSVLGTIQRALSRRDNSEQRVPSLDKAIEMVTIDVAYALNNEKNTGSIEVGKQADLIVLDHDITELPVKKIGSTQVLATIVGGHIVYDSDSIFQ